MADQKGATSNGRSVMFHTVVRHSRFHIPNKSNKLNQIICVVVQFGSLEILLSLNICCFIPVV